MSVIKMAARRATRTGMMTANLPPAAGQTAAPVTEPILVDTRQAVALCGSSLATWHRLRAAGKIGPEPVRLGGRVLWRRTELEAWIEAGCPPRKEWQARRKH
jgi:predicted DNA-binding transcriptional regulator AlpA